MNKARIKEILFGMWGYITIILVSLAYLATAIFTLGKTGKTWDEIFSSGILYLVLGVVISRLFASQGILNGMRDERYIQTVALHGKTVMEIEPYIDMLDSWCTSKIRTIRSQILLEGGMKYESCFSDRGDALGYHSLPLPDALKDAKGDSAFDRSKKRRLRRQFEKDERKRARCYRLAVKVKIAPLTSTQLTCSVGSWPGQPCDFGISALSYTNRMMRESAIWRILSAILFGYYGVKLVDAFSLQEFLLRASQLVIAVGMGAWSMYRAYLYVVDDHRGSITKKIDYLKMFEVVAKARRSVNNGNDKTGTGVSGLVQPDKG